MDTAYRFIFNIFQIINYFEIYMSYGWGHSKNLCDTGYRMSHIQCPCQFVLRDEYPDNVYSALLTEIMFKKRKIRPHCTQIHRYLL